MALLQRMPRYRFYPGDGITKQPFVSMWIKSDRITLNKATWKDVQSFEQSKGCVINCFRAYGELANTIHANVEAGKPTKVEHVRVGWDEKYENWDVIAVALKDGPKEMSDAEISAAKAQAKAQKKTGTRSSNAIIEELFV
jgi:hypothetical protein